MVCALAACIVSCTHPVSLLFRRHGMLAQSCRNISYRRSGSNIFHGTSHRPDPERHRFRSGAAKFNSEKFQRSLNISFKRMYFLFRRGTLRNHVTKYKPRNKTYHYLNLSQYIYVMFRVYVHALYFTRLQSKIQKISVPHHTRKNPNLLRYNSPVRPGLNRNLQSPPHTKTPSCDKPETARHSPLVSA